MNILQLSVAYAPSWKNGGLSRVMFDYAKELSRRGCSVGVYTADFSKELKAAVTDWPEAIDVSYFHFYGGPLARFYFNYSPWEISRWLVKNLPKFDVVHLSQTRALPNVMLHNVAKKLRKPYVLSSFGSLPRRRNGIKTVYDAMFVRSLVRDAASLFAQTEHEADVYREFGGRPDQIRLVPLAFNEGEFFCLPARGSFRSGLGIRADQEIVLFLGRLHKTKGAPLLLEAFARVRRSRANAILVMVGSTGIDELPVRREIEKRNLEASVRVVPAIYGPERLKVYCDADVYAITPAVYEETPLAAIEALACGTPVVTTERASVPGLHGSGFGFVAAPDDAVQIADAIVSELDQSKGNVERRQLIRRFAHDTFALRTIGQLLHDEFKRVTAK